MIGTLQALEVMKIAAKIGGKRKMNFFGQIFKIMINTCLPCPPVLSLCSDLQREVVGV